MFDLSLTLPLLLFLFPLAYSPGPGNSFFAALGAQGGVRATIPASAGYHVATGAVTLAMGLGFAEIVTRIGPALDLLRFGGAAWIIWIAWRIWSSPATNTLSSARAAGFGDGAILLLLNPKAWLIIALMFTQFTPTNAGAALWITVVFTLNNLLAFTLWSLMGDGLGRLFRQHEKAAWLNRLFALTLAGVAVWMVSR
jgi:threonine/homoserine/homoserine lactone efflux protein